MRDRRGRRAQGGLAVRAGPVLVAVLAIAVARPGHAAPPDAALQKVARAATFEVVLPKAKDDPLTYERPLPMELVPYAERNDAYVSIGSAFAIGPGRFVTAGHVLTAGFGSLTGPLAMRDSDGHVYRIDRVLQVSNAEDYAVFTIADPPDTLRPLQPGPPPAQDDVVYAVGNALGEGIVIRDGLLTSTTPEARSGRWNWLRFSAAASPGNSGGPLLDAQGRVIGVVVAKSPNENLNYALPIDRVLQGSTREAIFESQAMFELPVMHGNTVIQRSDTMPLPATVADLERRYRELTLDFYRDSERQLMKEHEARVFPRGDTADLMAQPDRSMKPMLLVQLDGDRWTHDNIPASGKIPLPGNGAVTTWNSPAVTMFRIQYPDGQPTSGTYADSKEQMDLLLRLIPAQRSVGAQSVRITSLGPATTETNYVDTWGRRWQVRRWDASPIQTSLIVYALPVPDGYVGLVMQSPPVLAGAIDLQMKTMTGFFTTHYYGTVAQWRDYLARPPQRAPALEGLSMGVDGGEYRYVSPRLRVSIPADLMAIGDQSPITVYTGYVAKASGVTWEAIGLQAEQSAATEDFVRVIRIAQPSPQVSRDIQTQWSQVVGRTGDFTGSPRRDSASGESWFATAKDVPGGGAAYVVRYLTQKAVTPGNLERRRDELLERIQVSSPPAP